MAYTVKKVAKLSGVSVRTLHFYDEIGLLKPAFVRENGYRYYGEEELLRLQQILFYRELGLPLAEIAVIMGAPDFEKVEALRSHRAILRDRVDRMTTLMATVDKTIARLEGRSPMANEELFEGFDWAQQERYEQEIRERHGSELVDESIRRTRAFTREDWTAIQAEHGAICQAWQGVLERGLPPDHPEAQAVARRHYEWLNHFYTPTKEVYVGLGLMYRDDLRFRKNYDAYHPGLADYMPEAMAVFAERELS